MIDTSKLSRALRVGGAGIRAVPCGESGVDLFLPDGACPWSGQKIANVEKPEPRYIQLLAGIGYYQDWLQRAKCEHEWNPYLGDCHRCGAEKYQVDKGHYTLLPEPADVCIVPGCGKVSLCPGHTLCLDCDGKWSDAPFVKPIDNNHWTYDDDRRAWAAKQSEAPTPISATTVKIPDNGPLPCDHKWSTFSGFCLLCGSTRKQARDRRIEKRADHLRDAAQYAAGPGDEPGSVRCRRGGCDGDVLPVSDDPYMVANYLCVTCRAEQQRIESALSDLYRPLPERIERARQELGFDDGYGVYSLPGEGK